MVVRERVELPGFRDEEIDAMRTMNALRPILVLALAAGAGCGSSEQGPEKFDLRVAIPRGLAYTHERTERVSGWMSVKAANGTETRQPLEKEEHRVYEDEIPGVDDGHVTKLRRKTLEWSLKRQAPGDTALRTVPRGTVGKTIVLRRTELGTEYDEADGLPEEEVKANQLGTLEALISSPAEPVAVGAQWPIDGNSIVEYFGGDAGDRALKVRTASGTGRLEAIDPGRVARVSVKIDVHGSFRQLLDVDVVMVMKLTVTLDLDNGGRPMAFGAHADGRILGQVDRATGPASYDGSFTFDATGQNRYR